MGNLTFSHAVGYRGVCKLGDVTVLCTGGNINLTQDPIMGSGVWGAGYVNAAPIAYAWNYLNLEGSVNFELTKGNVWGTLADYAFTGRTENHNITMLPDGINGFDGNGWLSSLSFDASEGSAITGSFNFKGDPSDGGFTASGTEDESGTGQGTPVESGLVGASLVPYWETKVIANDADLEDIISWSCSYNSDIQMLKCCNLQNSAPISADYILLGQMSGDGSYTIFRIVGDFDPNNYHSQKKDLTFETSQGSIIIPLAIVNSASTSMTTGASYVTAQFSFTALGDGVNSIMSMITTPTPTP